MNCTGPQLEIKYSEICLFIMSFSPFRTQVINIYILGTLFFFFKLSTYTKFTEIQTTQFICKETLFPFFQFLMVKNFPAAYLMESSVHCFIVSLHSRERSGILSPRELPCSYPSQKARLSTSPPKPWSNLGICRLMLHLKMPDTSRLRIQCSS